jgi:hypothetical protein
MGSESASYELALSADDVAALVRHFGEAAIERRRADERRIDYCLHDPYRYWIDLRIHLAPPPALEIRVALTNDPWSLRSPLERALTPLPPGLHGTPLRDGDGNELSIAGQERWLVAFEDDYGRRRDEFVARVGDFTAPLAAEHVYLYLHQTRWRQDNDDELAWHREREIARLQEAWEDDDAPEPPTAAPGA